jgi:hypothetical protein
MVATMSPLLTDTSNGASFSETCSSWGPEIWIIPWEAQELGKLGRIIQLRERETEIERESERERKREKERKSFLAGYFM